VSTFAGWPVTRQDLDPYYGRVEKMLDGQRYPFQDTPKTRVFAEAAEYVGYTVERPLLAVSFGQSQNGEELGKPEENLHGEQRYTCRLCGECDLGCNYGSKNTVDYTYLSAALRCPTPPQIRHLSEVKAFRPLASEGKERFEINYFVHTLPRSAPGMRAVEAPGAHTVTAQHLILSAGTLGTNYLLLKNRDNFEQLSQTLGNGFSANGDMLAFAVRCSKEVDGRRVPVVVDAYRGPVITSTIHNKPSAGLEYNFFIQEGGYPELGGWILPPLLDLGFYVKAGIKLAARLVVRQIRGFSTTNAAVELSEVLGINHGGSGLLLLLGMGSDPTTGRFCLGKPSEARFPWQKRKPAMLTLQWRGNDQEPYFETVRKVMRKLASAAGGQFRDPFGGAVNRMATAHPVGGCRMSPDSRTGVVDPFGQVHNYANLYVADGSVMPGPTGANPSLTIAAFAERSAERVIANHDAQRGAGVSPLGQGAP
jgi:cholesterol oxidase